MNYQIISVSTPDGTAIHVLVDRGDGSFESFPVDENNPRYQQWLAENPEDQ